VSVAIRKVTMISSVSDKGSHNLKRYKVQASASTETLLDVSLVPSSMVTDNYKRSRREDQNPNADDDTEGASFTLSSCGVAGALAFEGVGAPFTRSLASSFLSLSR